MRKYKLNENFFKIIDSEEKAYFLGFLFADGYINEKLNYIEITIHMKDKEILDNFVKFIYPDGRPLKIVKENYVRLVINSKILVSDLVRLGCIQAKTFKLKFPEIPEKYYRDFIRGYFDGDGSVSCNIYGTLDISMVGTIELLEKIEEILMDKCSVNETKYANRHPKRNNNIRALRYGGNILVNRIFHYLYDDSTIYLLRKKSKFLDVLENKIYFCNKHEIRELKKHEIKYDNEIYNQMELANILSSKLNIKSTTIRRKLQNGWTVNEILEIPLNSRRPSKRKTVCKLDEYNNIIDKYESVTIAAYVNSCHEGSIYQAIMKNKRLRKHYWKYE